MSSTQAARWILITGANQGCGLGAARAVLRYAPDTRVLIGSRDVKRGEEAVAGLRQTEVPEESSRVAAVQLDVTSQDSIRKAVDTVREILGQDGKLYGLVNNAGVGFMGSSMEDILAVNVYGLKDTTEAFLPLLDPVAGRVAHVASAAGPMYVNKLSNDRWRSACVSPKSWEEVQTLLDTMVKASHAEDPAAAFADEGLYGSDQRGDPYGLSKAAVSAYMLLQARDSPSLHVNSLTPGWVETQLTRPFLTDGKTGESVGMKQPSDVGKPYEVALFGDQTGYYLGSDGLRSPLDRYRSPGDPPFVPEQ